MKGATGPNASQSEPAWATIPAIIASSPLKNVALEKVRDIQSMGYFQVIVCWCTYQDSKTENKMDVEMPPSIRPINKMLKLDDSLVKQQNA